jgi:beta-lactamase regulating signal transducer with metallopeptidase domain/uncharacterized GH25 family protein
MNAPPEWASRLNWLLNHSLQAGVLVLLVLAVQWLFRRRLTARWRFALWWVVIARLLLPFSPPSDLSLFNYFGPSVHLQAPYYFPSGPPGAAVENAAAQMPPPVVVAKPNMTPWDGRQLITESLPVTEASSGLKKAAPDISSPASGPVASGKVSPKSAGYPLPWLPGLWLAGILILGAVVAIQLIRFHLKLVRDSAPAGRDLQELFDKCRREFPVSRRIELLETGTVQSPALYGLFRLRFLLPRGLGGQFENRELRYIFFHELAHVQRGDLWLNWLVTALQLIHWFNPLLWFGFARLRADRELACDELALLRAGDQAGTAYGETVVKLLEKLNQPAAIPGLVGILEDRKQMRRRISMIANFRKPGRWSVLAVFLLAAVATAALTDAQSPPSASQPIRASVMGGTRANGPMNMGSSYLTQENSPLDVPIVTNTEVRPDLTGQVLTGNSAPLPVSATVFITTAAPKTGSSTFCPSCYADCAKHATTDAAGNFKITSLDPQLKFQILAVAKGFKPQYVNHVDPADGPKKIKLEPIESTDALPDRSLHGRVVDSRGAPIAGSVVEMLGIENRDGGGGWGLLPDIDPLAVTDENGEFIITAKKPFDMLDVKVTARAFADKIFSKLASGGAQHELTLTEGATLTGRVLSAGKPLAGVSVGISGVDRREPNYLGHFEVGTDAHGRFVFVNLPPSADFKIYTLMDTMKNSGAVPLQQIRTGSDDETTDTGDLIAAPSHRLSGRVVLMDGQPLPAKTRLLISRDDAWDSMQVTPDQDGKFEATGIPTEMISLSARVKDYHVSGRNLSVDQMNPYRLIGRVDRDITNLVFMLEKGPDPVPDYSHVDPDYNESRQRPLRGAEGVANHSHEWSVAGHAFDGDTKQPIQNFRVTPGDTGNFNQPAWNTFHAVAGAGGAYQIYLGKRMAQPVLLAEADGYLPAVVTVLPEDSTNVDFVLKRGEGPAGTVVTPEGKPAAGATVVLLNDDFNEVRLDSAGELNAMWNQALLRQTDVHGNFSFKPVWGAKSIVASSTNGFAALSLDSFATNSTIVLEPFGKISGTLKRTSGPGTNEDLDVSFDDRGPVGLSRISMSNHAVTDARGHFDFDHVPPGYLQITYRLPMGRGGWQTPLLQSVDLKPGQSLVVNITTNDRPAVDETSFQPPPPPKLIPRVRVKGIVLLPDGQPASDASVALQVERVYLALGKATLTVNDDARQDGLLVNAGADGSFTLPMCEGAESVIALNEVGYAQVSLEQLKTSPQIKLQKWGRVQGVLRVGHHLGTNQMVQLSSPLPVWAPGNYRSKSAVKNPAITNTPSAFLPPPNYEPNAFQSRTDDRGQFVITFVPPGNQSLWRQVPVSEHSWTQTQLATVEVKPGETIVTNVGGTGRTIIGQIKFSGGVTADFSNGFLSVSTPMEKIFEKVRSLKTAEERAAFYQSPEVADAYARRRSFSVKISTDGSFKAEDVLPGRYEVQFQTRVVGTHMTSFKIFTSVQQITVPTAKDQNDDSVVNLGTVELKERILPVPETFSGKK